MYSRVLQATKWVLARALVAGLGALCLTFAAATLRTGTMIDMTHATGSANQCVVSQIDLSYIDSFSPAARGYVVSKVNVADVPPACWGKSFVVTLNSDPVGAGIFSHNTMAVDVKDQEPLLAGAVQSSGIGVSS